ncbi:hypothetical protein FIBSPDRAFT_857597 [Athelia psychrophila]|uniref:F-box domain-containing protein n=1 Tax=Athelia psychrophila TaxID=1759441 RepID=A0A166MNM0_9AGAM|nr:hypothetical protein FIBSPDRAFT_857597 [Fibularhizoctonia sp. CBS 109695]
MPHLRHLEVQPNSLRSWPSNLPMKLPNLRRLVVRDYYAVFLSAVEAPLLEDLALDVNNPTALSHEIGAALVIHCQVNLASVRKLHLTFTDPVVAASATHRFAQAFPFITQLSCRLLSRVPAPDDNAFLMHVYEALQEIDPLHGQLWPHVTTLDLCERYPSVFPTNALKTLLIRRAGAGYPIQTITLPKNQLDEGLAMAGATEPRVQVLENVYVAPCYTPEW